ncbi:MAG: hypothetical protein CVV30_04820 [Methanomicrobiales archaeon HGW-Methanomicrobiales-1]|nr:MAG: hypothetical protein CVV30_04820 [Methanomicrobiales archaeon HGW-Methanomicrobiales-1]
MIWSLCEVPGCLRNSSGLIRGLIVFYGRFFLVRAMTGSEGYGNRMREPKGKTMVKSRAILSPAAACR